MYFPATIWATSFGGTGENPGPTTNGCWKDGGAIVGIARPDAELETRPAEKGAARLGMVDEDSNGDENVCTNEGTTIGDVPGVDEAGEEAEETAGEAETKALSRLLRVWRGMGEAARTQSKAMQSGRRRKKGKSLAMLRDPQLHVDDTASAPASEQGAPRGNRWPAGLGVNFA